MTRPSPKPKKSPAPKSQVAKHVAAKTSKVAKSTKTSKAVKVLPDSKKPKRAPFDAQKAFDENQRRHQTRLVADASNFRNGQPSRIAKKSEQYEEFFKVLGETANVSRACERSLLSRDHVYDRRRAEPEFAKRWDLAYEQGYLKLEEEAQRRAFTGYEKPVYKNGVVIDYVKDYSDALAMFLLKGRMRKVFGDKQEINVKRGDAPYATLNDEELDNLIEEQMRGDE